MTRENFQNGMGRWFEPEPNTGCWLWLGCECKGYGYLYRANAIILAHREAYSAFVKDIPKGRLVCHRCDQPLCVNPSHLFVGTYGDNAQDMWAKGRNSPTHGEHNNSAKLTDEIVLELRRRSEEKRVDLAREFGVAPCTVSQAISGKYWKHLSLTGEESEVKEAT